MSRERRTEPIGWGGYSLISGFATLLFLILWFLSGEGRSGSLSYCLGGMPWLRQTLGVALLGCFASAIIWLILSFLDGSWRVGLLSLVVMFVSAPVITFAVLLISFGDPGPEGFQYCLFSPP